MNQTQTTPPTNLVAAWGEVWRGVRKQESPISEQRQTLHERIVAKQAHAVTPYRQIAWSCPVFSAHRSLTMRLHREREERVKEWSASRSDCPVPLSNSIFQRDCRCCCCCCLLFPCFQERTTKKPTPVSGNPRRASTVRRQICGGADESPRRLYRVIHLPFVCGPPLR